jgi:hypothetical protein
MAASHESYGGRGHPNRGCRACRGLSNKCIPCGRLDHIISSSTTFDATLLKWTLAKRKMIVQKYGTPGSHASACIVVLSDVSHDDTHATASEDMPTLEECTDAYDT